MKGETIYQACMREGRREYVCELSGMTLSEWSHYNQEILKEELDAIRQMNDFDLKLLLSEIQDQGWRRAQKLIPLIQSDGED